MAGQFIWPVPSGTSLVTSVLPERSPVLTPFTRTATSGNDYYRQLRVLRFLPNGPTTQQVAVRVLGDRRVEADETLFLNVLYALGAEVANRQGMGVIVNDDAQPAISISNATVTEGHTGFVEAVFTVSLSGPTFLPVSVLVRTTDGTALVGRDYRSRTTVLTFQPGGPLIQQVRVRVYGNRVRQSNRTFAIDLSAVSNALVANAHGLGTIVDDD